MLTSKGAPTGRPPPPDSCLGFHRISTNFHTYMVPNGDHISTAISTDSVISQIILPGSRHGIPGQLIYHAVHAISIHLCGHEWQESLWNGWPLPLNPRESEFNPQVPIRIPNSSSHFLFGKVLYVFPAVVANTGTPSFWQARMLRNA